MAEMVKVVSDIQSAYESYLKHDYNQFLANLM